MLVAGKKFALLKGSAAQYEYSESDSDTEVNFLFSGLYALSYMQRSMFMLSGGAGIYSSDESEFGVFAGVMYQRTVGTAVSLSILPRFHLVLADKTMTMLQLSVGLNFWLGNTGSPI